MNSSKRAIHKLYKIIKKIKKRLSNLLRVEKELINRKLKKNKKITLKN
jgi:2C-methyl-D-erythritol 2,4-cyclodiphosphate synthase